MPGCKPRVVVCLVLCLLYMNKVSADDSRCTNVYGTCQEDNVSCPGGYITGLCAGASTRRCCKPDDTKCDNVGGTCTKDTMPCTGSYVSNLCGGPAERRCCKPPSSSGSSTPTTYPSSCPRIVTRAEWKATAPKSVSTLRSTPALLFIHHTDGASCTNKDRCSEVLRSIQRYHMKGNNWYDIAYSFLVGGDGVIYEGRGWDRVGSHTEDYNSKSLAISFMGNFMTSNPSDAMLRIAQELIDCMVANGKLTSDYKLMGHRQAKGASTSCPGNSLYDTIKSWPHFDSGYDDSKCAAVKGTCQDDSGACPGGYKDRLCGGPKGRRCCLPAPSYPCPPIVTRKEWGAKPPTKVRYLKDNMPYVFIHHTDSPRRDMANTWLPWFFNSCDTKASCIKRVQEIQEGHQSQGYEDIGYIFLIGKDGNVYEGRGWGITGEHTKNFNLFGIGISFMGYYEEKSPTQEMLMVAQQLINCGVAKGKIAPDYKLHGHLQTKDTKCPGAKLFQAIHYWPHFNSEFLWGNQECKAMGGKCQIQTEDCPVKYVPGKCTSPSHMTGTVQCCIGYDDKKCTDVKGTCQASGSTCSGAYASGLCGGTGRDCCLSTTQSIACALLKKHDEGAVLLRDYHPSRVNDNATPIENIQDTCKGLPASRSSYTCTECQNPGAPGGTVDLSMKLLQFMWAMVEDGHTEVSSIAGACHSCRSRHYRGLAIDLVGSSRYSAYLSKCRAMGGTGIQETYHVHCQF